MFQCTISDSGRLTYIHKTSFILGTAWRMNGKHKLSDGPVNALSAELWMKLNSEVQGLQFWFFVVWKFVYKTLKPPVTCVCFNSSTGNTYHQVGLTESYLLIPKHWVLLSWSDSSFGRNFGCPESLPCTCMLYDKFTMYIAIHSTSPAIIAS